jgi:hypothetical protein
VAYDFDRLCPSSIPEHIEGPIFRAAKDPLDYGQKSLFNRKPGEPGLWSGPYRVVDFKPNERVVLAPIRRVEGHPALLPESHHAPGGEHVRTAGRICWPVMLTRWPPATSG